MSELEQISPGYMPNVKPAADAKCLECCDTGSITLSVAPIRQRFCTCEHGEQRKANAIAFRLANAHIEQHYKNASWEQAKAPQASMVRKWAEQYPAKGKRLLLLSDDTTGDDVYGTGKTSLAVCALRTLIQRGKGDGRFVTVGKMLHDIRARFDSPADSRDYLELFTEPRILVLDDLGAERTTDWTAECLYLLINERYVRDLATIVTSNLSLKGLVDTLGARTVHRLTEDAAILTVTGPNMRAKVKGTNE